MATAYYYIYDSRTMVYIAGRSWWGQKFIIRWTWIWWSRTFGSPTWTNLFSIVNLFSWSLNSVSYFGPIWWWQQFSRAIWAKTTLLTSLHKMLSQTKNPRRTTRRETPTTSGYFQSRSQPREQFSPLPMSLSVFPSPWLSLCPSAEAAAVALPPKARSRPV